MIITGIWFFASPGFHFFTFADSKFASASLDYERICFPFFILGVVVIGGAEREGKLIWIIIEMWMACTTAIFIID